MKLKPLNKNILIKADEEKEKTASGIVIAKSQSEEPMFGTVVAVGPEVGSVSEGDRVVFKKYAPDKVELDGEAYLICEEDVVIAKIEDEG